MKTKMKKSYTSGRSRTCKKRRGAKRVKRTTRRGGMWWPFRRSNKVAPNPSPDLNEYEADIQEYYRQALEEQSQSQSQSRSSHLPPPPPPPPPPPSQSPQSGFRRTRRRSASSISRPSRALPPTPTEVLEMLNVIDTNGNGLHISDDLRSKITNSKQLTQSELTYLKHIHATANLEPMLQEYRAKYKR